MDNVQKEFKRVHDKYAELRMRMIQDGLIISREQLCKMFTKVELIGHELLFRECFYDWYEGNVNRAMEFIREAYPETTIEDLQMVYDANEEMITSIYG